MITAVCLWLVVKDISVLRREALANLDKFLDEQLSKCNCHRPAHTTISTSQIGMHLSRIKDPLKKFNNNKGEIQMHNHAETLTTSGKIWVDNVLKEQYYIVDLLSDQHDTLSFINCWHMRQPDVQANNYHQILSKSTIIKLKQYLLNNQRFTIDKKKRDIRPSIIPTIEQSDFKNVWSEGLFVGLNVKEFSYQLSFISFRVNRGLNFNAHHRNHFSHNQLFKIFDWSVYSEEQSCVLSVSIKERELNKKHKQQCSNADTADDGQAKIVLGKNGKTLVITRNKTKYTIKKGMPLQETPRLDLYFDNSELTTLLLSSCACIEFICSRKDSEYCVLKFTTHTPQQPLPLFHQKQNGQQNQEECPKKKKRKSNH